MEKYPVKPGTAVQLPPRREVSSQKKPHSHRRGKLPPEEHVKALKKQVRILSVILAVSLILLVVFAVPAVKYFKEDHFLPGQNYSAVNASDTTDGD